jgi:nitrite reductase/ring-hydroxylating ferredoxin subunit
MADDGTLRPPSLLDSALGGIPAEVADAVRATPVLDAPVTRVNDAVAIVPPARRWNEVPAEGQDGLFSQSWFPICLARDVAPDALRGYDFLDGRVVVWRDAAGVAHVTSAFCPHLGASLEAGDVVDDTLRCAFHHWRYGTDGRCVATAIGDTPPRHAALYVFPSVEKYGLVWAFNGEAPLYALPDFPHPPEALLMKTIELPELMPVDPWVQCANTPDMQHIKTLHRVTFDDGDPDDGIEWGAYDLQYDFRGRYDTGVRAEWRIGVFGTSLYYQSAAIEGRWFGFLVPMGLPRPGFSRNFMTIAVRKTDDPAGDRAFLESCLLLEMAIVGEDTHVMSTMRFRPGTLTRSDRTLARYFRFLRAYPRAHPSRPFIT